MSSVSEVRFERTALASLREMVAAAPGPLVWLRDAAADPQEGAVDALIHHAPRPAASLPVDGQGQPVRPLIGRVDDSDEDAILAAIERRCVPLLHIQLTSLLVQRDAVLDLEPPDPEGFGWYAGAEWTARLFSRHGGVLVPASRVVVDGAPAGSAVHAMRAARSARWRRGETIRELHRTIRRSGG